MTHWSNGILRQRNRFRILASVALTLTIAAAITSNVLADDNAIALRYKFQPNQSLFFEYSQDMTMHVQKKAFKQKIESQTITDKHLRVISVDAEGNALIEPVIDRARLSSREDDGPAASFDSANGPDKCPAAFRAILETIGKPKLRIKFAPDGHVLSADGLAGNSIVAEQLESDPSLNFLIVLPNQPVKVGDTWKDDFEVNVQLDKTLKQGVKLRREYRLVKLDGNQADIELKMGILTPIRDPAIELQLSSRILSGTIAFDHQTGQIISRQVKVDHQVINALGDGSLVRTIMTQTERSVANPKLARRETP